VFDVLRDWLFGLTLGLSLLVHGAVLFLVSRIDFEMPVEVAPRQGKASVRLRASVDQRQQPTKQPQKESPRPTKDVPPAPDPVEVLVTELPEPLQVPTRLPPPAPPEPRVTPPKPEKVMQVASVPSPASEASEGAVDQLPVEAVNPPPPYPPEAKAAGQEGRVWLRVKVDATGKVVAISIHESSGYELLDDAALRTVRRWIFYPAKRNCKPVSYEYLKPVRFYIRSM